jgi:DNA-binding beta-propeller fold protein YncE
MTTHRLGLLTLAVIPMLAACGFEEPAIPIVTRETLSRVHIPPVEGRTGIMDVMIIDPDSHLLYVADSTDPNHPGVDVVDVSGPVATWRRTISTGDGLPNGLALVPERHRLYVGRDDGTVAVVDIAPGSPTVDTVVGSLTTGHTGNADLLTYDPHDHRVYAAYPVDGLLAVIDTDTERVVGRVADLGSIDQPLYDPADGMVYVGDVDDDQLLRVDPRTNTVAQRLQLPEACQPHGIAVNPRTNQGMIGCAYRDQPLTIAWDFGRGTQIRTFDLAGAGDLLTYDPSTDHFYFAASNYAPAEMAVFSGTSIEYLTAVPTSHKSHTVAFDPVHRTIYTPDGLIHEAGLYSFPDPVSSRG